MAWPTAGFLLDFEPGLDVRFEQYHFGLRKMSHSVDFEDDITLLYGLIQFRLTPHACFMTLSGVAANVTLLEHWFLHLFFCTGFNNGKVELPLTQYITTVRPYRSKTPGFGRLFEACNLLHHSITCELWSTKLNDWFRFWLSSIMIMTITNQPWRKLNLLITVHKLDVLNFFFLRSLLRCLMETRHETIDCLQFACNWKAQ